MKSYTAERGDTVYRIAALFAVSPHRLCEINPVLEEPDSYIAPGTVIQVPDSAGAAGCTRKKGVCTEPFHLRDVDAFREKWLETGLIQCETIGHSVMNQPIYAFTCGSGKKQVFYSGGWHANEWMTSKFLCEWLDEVAEAVIRDEACFGYDVAALLKEITLYVVPMVNPDGIELVQQGNYPGHPFYEKIQFINRGGEMFDHWSANIRGVDLNHQWPAGWQKEADESPPRPWPRHYSGRAALTEPEAQAVHRFTLNHDFAYVIAFHSQGQMIFWGYKGFEPPESKEMVCRLSRNSSYVPVHTADSDGGYKDWFIQETGRPGFTVELGTGTNPLPFRAFSEIWANGVPLALEGLVL
ncbi:M14 family metallopeptidase [Alteribacter natronophilus]|uniref:M14 family metallopeptidase n=1 Tax=Alteribacter natronophilus TaxID=2583810 RepID=UPI00110EAF5B|nr:M14 family metallopeptidase [Alteribacter natronophilus]TMW73638.1 LysM peptidoglycan-binding domain-containing protein [Alteribacter natronophilus]